jgi:hypothetical protein
MLKRSASGQNLSVEIFVKLPNSSHWGLALWVLAIVRES